MSRGHILEKLGTGRGRASQLASKRLTKRSSTAGLHAGARGGYFDEPRSHNTDRHRVETRVFQGETRGPLSDAFLHAPGVKT